MNAIQVWHVLADEKAERFAEGFEQGIEKGIRKVLASLTRQLPDADDATIANLSSQPIELVAQARSEPAPEKG